ncbi:MAG TPA: hypothetical protein PKU97_12825, partial [Kofleriaceae bacterium]|nr:hypothetical protein [Kofleriaceae bacterium]
MLITLLPIATAVAIAVPIASSVVVLAVRLPGCSLCHRHHRLSGRGRHALGYWRTLATVGGCV